MKVIRRAPELITPAKPTPRELKYLSDIDDQKGVRIQLPVLQIYINSGDLDPARVLRDAIAESLVYYYPFAGRLREVGNDGKLAVDCTGEGVLFTEADADVGLDELGDVVQIPIHGWEELVFDVPGSVGLLGTPLLLFQVTRLKCGGCIVGTRLNHSMSDAGGLAQFLKAVSEMARGASAPSTLPVWQRELLNARDPPRVTCVHQEFENIPIGKMENKVLRTFFFGAVEVAALRKLLPPNLPRCSTFELVVAVLWRTRTLAMNHNPFEEVQMICVVGARPKFDPPLPKGYYGNAIAHPAVKTTAGYLTGNPIASALEIIQKAKNSVTGEYMKSLADYLVLNGWPSYTGTAFLVSDVTRVGLEDRLWLGQGNLRCSSTDWVFRHVNFLRTIGE
uniref:Uncharacterized protein n=1 Tax=Kalanchoe fedtschenkoi TaxID=63787 RepID=A0A7N0TMX7_KALFE